MATDDHSKPPRVKPRINAAPRIRQFYWCDFPKDAHLPEFWKIRPVIVISYRNKLSGAVTVVPCSSQDQSNNIWAHRLEMSIDGRDAWAICDKLTTVAVSRLTADRSGIKRMEEAEFKTLLQRVLKWLPVVSE